MVGSKLVFLEISKPDTVSFVIAKSCANSSIFYVGVDETTTVAIQKNCFKTISANLKIKYKKMVSCMLCKSKSKCALHIIVAIASQNDRGKMDNLLHLPVHSLRYDL